LLHQYLEIFDEQGKMMMQMLGISAQVLREPVDWILEHSKRDHLLAENRTIRNLDKLVVQFIELLDNKREYHFIKDFDETLIAVNKFAR
jgi:hypothetical protein